MTIHILILNLDNLNYTKNCISSVLKSDYKNYKIYLLDNGSKKNEMSQMKKLFPREKNIFYCRSEKNLGFASGNNFLLKKIVPKTQDRDLVLFLNNDAEVDQRLLSQLSNGVNFETKEEILAVTMNKLDQKNEIDNIGITLNKAFLGKNRKTPKEKLFCPSGGCMAISTNCLKTIYQKTGEYFDDDYFCYAEDIDLSWRGLLHGFKEKYIKDALCYHKGGATSGGNFNKFVMYHTLRNNLYNIVKNVSAFEFFTHSFYIIFFQIALIFRYIFTPKFSTLLKVYFDFFKHLPILLRKRKIIHSAKL